MDDRAYAAYQAALQHVRDSMSAVWGRLDTAVFGVSAGTLGILSSLLIAAGDRHFVRRRFLFVGCILLLVTMACTLGAWVVGLLHHVADAWSLARWAHGRGDYDDFGDFVSAPCRHAALCVLLRQHVWAVVPSVVGLACFVAGLSFVVAFALLNL